MFRFVFFSLVGHILIAGLFWAPWDFFRSRTTVTAQPIIPLELVTLSSQTVAPPVAEAAQDRPLPEPPTPQPESPLPQPAQPEAPAEPEPKIQESAPLEPMPDLQSPPPEPIPPQPSNTEEAPALPLEQKPPQDSPPEPKNVEIKKPEKIKEKDQEKKIDEKEKNKKKKKDDEFLDNIVKDLTPKKNNKKTKKQKNKKDVLDDLEKNLTSKNTSSGEKTPRVEGIPGDKLSLSEVDAIRSQVAACWNVPAGVQDAENLRVELRVHMHSDGTVHKVDVISTTRMGDPLFRAATESAVRALLNPQCNPLKLPAHKYNEWKTFTINFDPKEMF